MIEIKTIGGKVLYTAGNATDVRTALGEAAEARANLARANLAGAYLARANLADAYLADANLARANLVGANLVGANLVGANLARANLVGANLARADLAGAYLAGANLARANLAGAYLARANLADANLAGAKGFNPHAVNAFLLLADQVGKIRAYKLVNADGEGPFNGGITYKVGETYEVKKANTDPRQQCGAGINIATLPWCIQNWRQGYRILLVEFTKADIAAIPMGDGKFRCRKIRVVREINLADVGVTDAS